MTVTSKAQWNRAWSLLQQTGHGAHKNGTLVRVQPVKRPADELKPVRLLHAYATALAWPLKRHMKGVLILEDDVALTTDFACSVSALTHTLHLREARGRGQTPLRDQKKPLPSVLPPENTMDKPFALALFVLVLFVPYPRSMALWRLPIAAEWS